MLGPLSAAGGGRPGACRVRSALAAGGQGWRAIAPWPHTQRRSAAPSPTHPRQTARDTASSIFLGGSVLLGGAAAPAGGQPSEPSTGSASSSSAAVTEAGTPAVALAAVGERRRRSSLEASSLEACGPLGAFELVEGGGGEGGAGAAPPWARAPPPPLSPAELGSFLDAEGARAAGLPVAVRVDGARSLAGWSECWVCGLMCSGTPLPGARAMAVARSPHATHPPPVPPTSSHAPDSRPPHPAGGLPGAGAPGRRGAGGAARGLEAPAGRAPAGGGVRGARGGAGGAAAAIRGAARAGGCARWG